MKLTGEEARKYIENNPGAKYTVLRGNAPVPQAQPQDGFFKGLLKGAVEPLVRLYEGVNVSTEKDLAELQGRKAKDTAPIFSGFENINTQAEKNPFLNVTKGVAGVGSFAVPGGAFGKGVTGLAKAGAVSGALGGFSASDATGADIIGDTAKGALFGGATGGGLGLASKGIGAIAKKLPINKAPADISKSLKTVADQFEQDAFRKSIGTAPTMGQGKNNLVKKSLALSKAENFSVRSADDLEKFSEKLFADYGGKVDEFAQRLDKKGVRFDIDEIVTPLTKELEKIKSPQLRKPYEKVLNDIRTISSSNSKFTASELLNLRREWGKLGNWNQFTPTSEQNVAKVWEDAYNNINRLLDKKLASEGMKEFRPINEILKTAIDQKNWAIRAKATSRGVPVLNDMTQDAVAFGSAVGGGPGSILAAGLSKAGQRYGEAIVGKTARAGSNLAGKFGSLGAGDDLLTKIAGVKSLVPQGAIGRAPNIISALSGSSAVRQDQLPQGASIDGMGTADDMTMNDIGMDMQPAIDPQQYQANVFLQLIASGMKASEANQISEAITIAQLGSGMGISGTESGLPQPTTEGGAKASFAVSSAQKALDILRNNPSVTGKTQKAENVFSRLVGRAGEASEYEAQLETARNAFLNIMAGATLTDSEIARYEKSLPKITDSPAQAEQRLNILISELTPLIR